LAQTIGDVMSAAVVTAPASPLSDAVQVMVSERTGALPVVADGRLVGVLTDRDIVVRGVAAGLDLQAACVGDVASSGLVYVRPNQPVGHALLLMAAHQLRRVPVVDDSLRVIGTITQVDIARSPAARRRAATAASLKPPGLVPISRGNGERSRRRR
jgi:CBS domain-containing protein